MKLFFLSNYYNHHQSGVAQAWHTLTQGQFRFVETGKMRQERKDLGYEMEKPPYVRSCFNEQERKQLLEEMKQADVVVLGSAPEHLIADRQKQKQLTYRYGERIYKNTYQWYKWPFRLLTFYKKFGRYKKTYLLCASAYTAADYAKHFAYLNKTYKWGYFPQAKRYNNPSEFIGTKKKTSILWCGRFLDWKHPEHVVEIAKRLHESGYDFEVNLIGIGELQEAMQQKVMQYHLENYVHFLGAMKPEKVREYMEKAGIYLFTSDRKEGWGAVLNEAMNSGCAVVASHAIGAVPFLVKDGQNGIVYKSLDVDMLYEKVKMLLEQPQEQERLGMAAYKTIAEEWNADVAAERLLVLTEHLLNGEKYPDLYESGPCSKAEILKDNWFDNR